MPEFEVILYREVTDREYARVVVEAADEDEAAAKAIDMAEGEDAEEHEDDVVWESDGRTGCTEVEAGEVKELP